jgi:hypothetical protein
MIIEKIVGDIAQKASGDIPLMIALHAGCAIETELKEVGGEFLVKLKTKNKVRILPNISEDDNTITVQEDHPEGMRTVILKLNSVYER